MKTILFLLIICYNLNPITPLSKGDNSFELEITQTNYNDLKTIKYRVVENKFSISKLELRKNKSEKYKKVYSIQINNNDLEKLKILSLELIILNDEYIQKSLGGSRVEISFKNVSNTKTIVLENSKVPQIDNLFKNINNLIPLNKSQYYLY